MINIGNQVKKYTFTLIVFVMGFCNTFNSVSAEEVNNFEKHTSFLIQLVYGESNDCTKPDEFQWSTPPCQSTTTNPVTGRELLNYLGRVFYGEVGYIAYEDQTDEDLITQYYQLLYGENADLERQCVLKKSNGTGLSCLKNKST